jgi:hypothetical protein
MLRNCALLLAATTLLSACADFYTVGRRTDLAGGGKAIHLDGQQRLVYQNSAGQICAEPSPDAIQAIAAGFGAGAGVSDKGSAALSSAIQQSTAGIGLRTQSITLMRDALYRICEAYSGGVLLQPDVVQLLQRSQDMSLSVLAIEQLTGAVVAKQVVLQGSANSTAASEVTSIKDQLAAAREDEKQKLTAMREAEDKYKTDKAKLDAMDKPDLDPKPDPTELADLKKLVGEEKAAAETAATDYADAKSAREAIEKVFGAAKANASATASGTGQFSTDGGNGKTIDKDTAEVISKAVYQIVSDTLNKGHLTDTCINYLSANPGSRARVAPDGATPEVQARVQAENQAREKAENDLRSLCGKIIAAELDNFGKPRASNINVNIN